MSWKIVGVIAALAVPSAATATAVAVTSPAVPTGDRNTVVGIELLGEATIPTGAMFDGTEIGGLSGIAYDPASGGYVAVSDDRSQRAPARMYDLTVDLADGALDAGDVTITGVTTLLDTNGEPFPTLSVDPEGIALDADGNRYISSEGDVSRQQPPSVRKFAPTGESLAELPVPGQFVPTGASGPRNNLVFESLTLTPDESVLYTATENALVQDGPPATLDGGSPSRVLVYGSDRQPLAQYVYETGAIPAAPVPPDAFADNGLVELLALDDEGTLLALERSFAVGAGNSINLYEVWTGGAVDVSELDGIDGLEADPAVAKRHLLDFHDLGIALDNSEAMTFGPALPDGRPTLIVVSDNNFSASQVTQFLAFALDVEEIPTARPVLETPRALDGVADLPAGERAGDSDDAAIWVHPRRTERSLVIATLKEGGLQVTDLRGRLVQRIDRPGTSFNNVDIIEDMPFKGGRTEDVAIASDRFGDTIAVFRIVPGDGTLQDVTGDVPASIFGVDDEEATAYGLAAYTSPVSGRTFVFVTQASGNQVAQLELSVDRRNRIAADVVRRLEVPVDGDLEDAQSEGVVADPDLGVVHIAMEDGIGILTFDAEPDGGADFDLLYDAAQELLVPDIEGLDLYLGAGTSGYIVASSQGDSTFHVWQRDGDRAYVGRFALGAADGVDATDESDGFDIVSAPLGGLFPHGLMVAHDGQDEPQHLNLDGDEIENAATNFVYVSWDEVAATAGLTVDTSRHDRRR